MPKVYNRHHGNAPADAVYIGRGTIYGNEFVIGPDGDRDAVCDKYEAKVEADPALRARFIAELRGRDVVCSCKPRRCHGDYLVRIANAPTKDKEAI